MSHVEHPVAPTTPDLLNQDAVHELVADRYRRIVGRATSVAPMLYASDELAGLPDSAVAGALGVGNPVRFAHLRAGDLVLDLGSGGGLDTLLAARAVAPGGRAIGLDILPEMLERAAAHAREAGVTNVEWLRGEIENIPLPDASVDVVVSNGVVNLSPRKSRVLFEAYRVLRSGGRISMADIIVEDDLPPEVIVDPQAWAG
jgi:SAM-dependent methyltransferase